MTADIVLTPPASVAEDPAAVELLRVWWSKDQPAMVVKPAFEDPRAIGAVLAHAASHMAYAYAQRTGIDQNKAHMAILEGFRTTVMNAEILTVVEPKAEDAQ